MILDIILPVFGLVLFGYLAARFGLFKTQHIAGLANFCFTFAVPVLLFSSLSGARLPSEIDWGFMLSFYIGGLATFFAGMMIGRRFFALKLDGQALMGMTSAFSNTALLGIPLIIAALGKESSLAVFMLISVHSAVYFSLVTVLVSFRAGAEGSIAGQIGAVLKDLATNPILIGLVCGMAVSISGITLPHVITTMASQLGSAGVPASAFAMGATLSQYRIAGSLPQAAVMVLLKQVMHPLLVWALAYYVFGVTGIWLGAAVLMAAMPTGINVYVFAARYGGDAVPATSTAILVSTAMSVVTMALVSTLLGLS
jgi:malonate transporter and related proteins